MKNYISLRFILLATVVSFSLLGCKKDEVVSNEGSAIFWYGLKTANGLVADDAVSLTFYVDGQVVGSSATNVYWKASTGPDCGEEGSITVKKDLGEATNKVYTYSVMDQTGHVYWQNVVNFSKNNCESVELVW